MVELVADKQFCTGVGIVTVDMAFVGIALCMVVELAEGIFAQEHKDFDKQKMRTAEALADMNPNHIVGGPTALKPLPESHWSNPRLYSSRVHF